MLKFIQNKWFQIFIILLLPFLAYLNILGNEFVWDDIIFIKGWETPTSFSNFPQFLNGSAPIGFEGVYRPIKIIILAVNIFLFGNQTPFLYHLQSILIHLSITLLVFLIVKKLTKEPILALIVGLLFGLNPVHTENISWATASLDLFGVLFILISYLIYLYSQRGENKKLLVFSLIFAFLAFFSYELTFPFFLLIFITDYFIFAKKIKPYKSNLIYAWYIFPVLLYFLTRSLLLHLPARQSLILDNIYPTMLIMAKVIVKYAQILIFPLNLNVVPTISPEITGIKATAQALKLQTLFDPVAILGIIILVLLVFAIFYFKKRAPVISFSLAWILISFIPFSNIVPVGIFYAERYLYLASFGFCLILGYIFINLFNSKLINSIGKKILLSLLITLLVFYFARIVIRNNDWHSNLTFWQQTLLSSPNNPDVLNNLGNAYLDKNELNLALKTYGKALTIDENNGEYYHNIGIVYSKKRDDGNTLKYFKKAYELDNQNEFFAIKLAQFYYDKENYDKLLDILKTTKFKNYQYIEHFYMSAIYQNAGKLNLAKEESEKSIKLKNTDAWSYYQLASVYIAENNFIEAEKLLNKAIRLDSTFTKAYIGLAKIYILQNNFEKALTLVNKAIEIDPENLEAQQIKNTIQVGIQQSLLQFLQGNK